MVLITVVLIIVLGKSYRISETLKKREMQQASNEDTLSPHLHFFKFLGAFARLRKATISFVMSFCPHETAVLQLD